MTPEDEKAMLQVIDERDYWEKKATELAEAVGKHLGRDVGVHSNLNCPVLKALEYLDEAP